MEVMDDFLSFYNDSPDQSWVSCSIFKSSLDYGSEYDGNGHSMPYDDTYGQFTRLHFYYSNTYTCDRIHRKLRWT